MKQLRVSIKNTKKRYVGEGGLSEKELCSIDQRLLQIYQEFEEQAQSPEMLIKTNTAWRKVHEMTEIIDKVKHVAKEVIKDFQNGTISDFVILGIGGSDLGARALHEALNCGLYFNLKKERSYPRIHFIGDNSCPEEITALLEVVELEKTILTVISKSGRTPETLANYFILKQKLNERIGEDEANKQVIAITGENNDSELWVKGHDGDKQLFRAFLPVPDGIGGRFSVFSPVGLLFAAVSGLDIDEMMQGITQAEKRALLHPLGDENCAYILAKVLYLLNELRSKNIIAFFPFDNRLEGVSRWFRQLWAESLGKTVMVRYLYDKKKSTLLAKLFFSNNIVYKVESSTGISVEGHTIDAITLLKNNKNIDYTYSDEKVVTGTTPLAWVGSRDNHSSWQLGSAGPRDKVVVFIQVEQFLSDVTIPVEKDSKLYFLNNKLLGNDLEKAAQMGTEIDAVTNGVVNLTIYLPEKNERNVADLLYTLMMTTAIAGSLYQINAFDQPAVEGYKIKTKEILMGQASEEIN
ncbi:hypothetical protein ACFL1T_03515 [Chlamydiota bacterium]